jgi:DNA-binding NtrC family response regulator
MSARILVVDDDAEIALLVRKVLTAAGYSVSLATSAAQARSRFERETFDLVITDRQMPEESGADLIRALRRIKPTLPVVMMTAYPSLRNEGVTLQGYLAKPFSRLQSIYEVVDRTLALSQLVGLRRAG